MNFACAAAVVSTLAAIQIASAGENRVGDVDPITPAQKLDRALNGTFAWPATPKRFAVDWKPDDTGFAKDRLFSVPPAGVHPRILFGPDDLPNIRTNLKSNEAGIGIEAGIRALLAKGIDQPSTWEGACFEALAASDLEGFRKAFKEDPMDDVPPGSGFRMNSPGRVPAAKWGVRHPLLTAMQAKAFIALLDNDEAAGRKVATALATYAAFIRPRVDAANARPDKEFHWSTTRMLVGQEIAFAYDWSWKWMNETQRETLRKLIVDSVIGKFALAMDLPPHWRNWNHLGMDDVYAACMFAIEGEPGDDPRGRDRIFEVFRDYLTYGIDTLGSGTEGVGYQTMGIGHMSPAMLAFANRGKNLFVHPHWRKHTESWLVQTMQPFGGAWMSNSDLGNFAPSLWMLQAQKYLFPDSPGIDYVYRSHPLIAAKDWAKIAADGNETQWLLPAVPSDQDTRAAAQQAAAKLVGGGLTFHDPQRGTLYTRTGWGPNDLSLHIDCRDDTTFANHDHPDRGQFTLSALGRAWACDGYRDTESKYHNIVTIDGRGQAYFATPGKWIEHFDNDQITGGVIDAKYCWDWMWMKSSFTESAESLQRRHQAVFIEPAKVLQARVPVSKWEADPTVADYYEGFATKANGDPRMWDDEDGWVVRAQWYPVKKAIRTVQLIRGKHPFVLVADDIRKDDAEHLYEWRMNMPADVQAVSINGQDILLGDETTARAKPQLNYAFQGKPALAPAKGDRLLLVRTLENAGPDLPTLQPIPMVATVEYKKTDDSHQFTGRSMGMGTQVVIGSRSVEPRFLVMLFPHQSGDELPKSTWNPDKTELVIAWKDQTTTLSVTSQEDGRRVFRLKP